MSTLKSIGVSAIVALIVVLGLMYLRPATTVVPLGAVSGPDLLFDYINLNGVKLHPREITSFTSATTSPINVQAPVNATTTLMLGSGCYFSVASTTAKEVTFSRSADPNATTTLLFGANVAANARASIVATTTTDSFVFSPTNDWLVVSLEGGSGVDSPTGRCSFLFIEQ